MEDSESQTTCSNCGKTIAENNLMLHEMYCFRNVTKCPKCSDMVDKAEKKTHDHQKHRLINCKYCKQDFEAYIIKDHYNTCNRQPKTCPFCSCPISPYEYEAHVYSCGSRTKKCDLCHKNILVREFKAHEDICILQEYQPYNNNKGKGTTGPNNQNTPQNVVEEEADQDYICTYLDYDSNISGNTNNQSNGDNYEGFIEPSPQMVKALRPNAKTSNKVGSTLILPNYRKREVFFKDTYKNSEGNNTNTASSNMNKESNANDSTSEPKPKKVKSILEIVAESQARRAQTKDTEKNEKKTWEPKNYQNQEKITMPTIERKPLPQSRPTNDPLTNLENLQKRKFNKQDESDTPQTTKKVIHTLNQKNQIKYSGPSAFLPIENCMKKDNVNDNKQPNGLANFCFVRPAPSSDTSNTPNFNLVTFAGNNNNANKPKGPEQRVMEALNYSNTSLDNDGAAGDYWDEDEDLRRVLELSKTQKQRNKV